MADYRYSYNGPEEGIAKALLKDAAVSTKVSIEICNYLRGKTTKKAKTILELVLEKKHAIPFTRFTDGVGHRPGPLAAGRYPQKGAQAFLDLVKLAEANASHNDLAEELVITHLSAQKASTPFRYGRQRRRQTKRTHIELVVKEVEGAKKKTKKKTAERSLNAERSGQFGNAERSSQTEQSTERGTRSNHRTQNTVNSELRSEPQPRTTSEKPAVVAKKKVAEKKPDAQSTKQPIEQSPSKPKQDKEAHAQ